MNKDNNKKNEQTISIIYIQDYNAYLRISCSFFYVKYLFEANDDGLLKNPCLIIWFWTQEWICCMFFTFLTRLLSMEAKKNTEEEALTNIWIIRSLRFAQGANGISDITLFENFNHRPPLFLFEYFQNYSNQTYS